MKDSNWTTLKKFLVERFKKPLSQPGFIFYFVFIVIIVGSIGFISELFFGLKNCEFDISYLTSNASSVFIALLAASSIEFILINETELVEGSRKSDIQLLGVVILISGFLLWILSALFRSSITGFVISLLGLFFSYLFWWIANSENKKIAPSLKESTEPLGGLNPQDDLKLAGNYSGFKTE